LVVVEAVLGRVIFAADVNYCVACCKVVGIASTDQWAGCIGRKETEKVYCQGFVGMEMTTVDLLLVTVPYK
jgi:hypothetical protein